MSEAVAEEADEAPATEPAAAVVVTTERELEPFERLALSGPCRVVLQCGAWKNAANLTCPAGDEEHFCFKRNGDKLTIDYRGVSGAILELKSTRPLRILKLRKHIRVRVHNLAGDEMVCKLAGSSRISLTIVSSPDSPSSLFPPGNSQKPLYFPYPRSVVSILSPFLITAALTLIVFIIQNVIRISNSVPFNSYNSVRLININ